MAFEARRLRVQLPCGQATVQERPALLAPQDCDVFSNPNCPTIFDTCAGAGVTFPECAVATDTGCGITRPCRFDSATCAFDTCAFQSPCAGSCPGGSCRLDTCGFVSPRTCRVAVSDIGCRFGTDIAIDPGQIVINPEQLPVLRQQLEAQLAEVAKAEQALREREQG